MWQRPARHRDKQQHRRVGQGLAVLVDSGTWVRV